MRCGSDKQLAEFFIYLAVNLGRVAPLNHMKLARNSRPRHSPDYSADGRITGRLNAKSIRD
jgi:hypothetical protein